MNPILRFLCFGSWLLLTTASGEAVKDREGAVRTDRASLEKDPRWIYNDFERGFTEARRTGKPLMVVLRCVPCVACAGIDAAVLKRAEEDLAPLLDQFVCVRVINANALDLARFQFDFDLSFSAIFFNGDGTVYGRFGSWRHQRDAADATLSGYQRALEGALKLHRDYPLNRLALAGKQGKPAPFGRAVEIPALAAKYKSDLDWEGKVVPSCVHCHQIGDAVRSWYRGQRQPIPVSWIYPQPTPETIGLTLAADQVARVEAVAADSIAARAGLKAGDEIIVAAGQPLISVADMSWALHGAPAAGAFPLRIKRGGQEQSCSLNLPPNWRAKSDISRRVGTWPMRGMATGGLILEDLNHEQRAARGLGRDQMALLVKGLGQYGLQAAAKKAGFQKDDVLLEIGELSKRMTESELIGQLLQNHEAGEKLKTTVLRGAERIELQLPIQ